MNNVYPVTSTRRRKGAERGRETNLPSPYETCTWLFKTITSKVAILLYVAIFSVLGHSALAQTNCVTSATLTANNSNACAVTVNSGTATSVVLTVTVNSSVGGSTTAATNSSTFTLVDVNAGPFSVTNGGGAGVKSANTVTYILQLAGPRTYQFQVTANNIAGACTPTVTNTQTVVVNRTPTIVAVTGSTVCQGSSGSLQVQVGEANGATMTETLTLTIRDNSAGTTFTRTVAGTGTSTVPVGATNTTTSYTVTNVASASGCGTSYAPNAPAATNTVTYTAGPVSPALIPSSPTICQSSDITLNVLNAGSYSNTATYDYFRNGFPIVNGTQTGTSATVTGAGTNTLVVHNADPNFTGTYTVRVTDPGSPAGCQQAFSGGVPITVNPLPAVTVTPGGTMCPGTSAAFTVTNNTLGTPQISVNYTVTGPTPGTSTTTAVLSTGDNSSVTVPVPGSAGTYTFTINFVQVVATGCTLNNPAGATTTATVASPTTFTATNSGLIVCNGGNGTITVTNGANPGGGTVTYTIAAPANGAVVGAQGFGQAYRANSGTFTSTANGTTAGDFAVTLTSGTSGIFTITAVNPVTGCSTSTTVTVTQPSAITGGSFTNTTISCGGGTSVVSGSLFGGTGAGVATTTNYTVQLVGVNGTPGTFNAGTVTTTSNGTNGTFSAAGIPAGTYAIRVARGPGGCASTTVGTIDINQPTPANVVTQATQPLCFGTLGSITASVSNRAGTVTYTLSGAASQVIRNAPASGATFTQVAAGSYTLTVTEPGSSCSTVVTPIVINPAPEAATGSVTVQPPYSFAGGTYTTTNPSTNNVITVNCPGGTAGIVVTRTDAGAASTTTVFNLLGANGAVVSPTSTTGTSASYTLPAGTYTPTFTNQNGCLTVLAPITVVAPPDVQGTVTAAQVCPGNTGANVVVTTNANTVTLARPGFTQTLAVSGGTVTFANMQVGTYTITGQLGGACGPRPIGSGTVTVSNFAGVLASSPATYECTGGNATLTLNVTGTTGSNTYQLILNNTVVGSNNTGVFSNVASGTYDYIITNATSGCVIENNPAVSGSRIVVTGFTPVNAGVVTFTASTCVGGTDARIVVTPAGGSSGTPYSVFVNGATASATQSTVNGTTSFFNLPAGAYSVTVSQGACVASPTSVTVVAGPATVTGDLLLNASAPADSRFTGAGSTVSITYTITNTSFSSVAINGFELVIQRPREDFTVVMDPSMATNWTLTSAPGADVITYRYNGVLSCGATPTSVQTRISYTQGQTIGRVPYVALSATVQMINGNRDSNAFNNAAPISSEITQ